VTVSNQVQQLAPANRNFYKFKEGLKIYLSAISRMKGDPRQAGSRGKDRFNDTEKRIIGFFLGALSRTTLDRAHYQEFLNKEFNPLRDKVEQIQEKDDDLLLLLKLWLALIAAEDGYNWTANDAAELDAVGRLR
jgi:hypothetical protein